ncbi:SDR family NAD(P)-dependent oxidoreductase [Rhizosaccharibacter radicis]|uniref:SDR family NAD(P)-dependent oxidoreductase n=1 Tax=Rhizosaccharibacter radicis TaxID=2782605 RepID=A0ABT1W309_9PROT|nr:SDR family NAD(P)-dependent oxidoreductase [Acetobacteraceae bacterium KSS12]
MRADHVLVTGASSGIGEALALALAGPGRVLHLAGRHAGRLDGVADACAARGAIAQARVIDVGDEDAMAAWIGGAGPLDLVLACAGISGGTAASASPGGSSAGGQPGPAPIGTEPSEQVGRIMRVNLAGVINTVLPAIAVMRDQPRAEHGWRGRIAAISSVAAFVSSPTAPSYCASKAAVDRWMVGSAAGWRPHGIVLSSVCCGFVRSRMTEANDFRMPGLMDADRAAQLILRGVARNQRRIVFPGWMGMASRMLDLLPPRWSEAILQRQGGKAPLKDD